jgi:hypothetical protein
MCEQQEDGSTAPPSLLDLCVRMVALRVDEYPTLKLPAGLSHRVLQQLVSRAWLDLETLARLRHCHLLTIELPGCAPLDHDWLRHICGHHSQLSRLDISSVRAMPPALIMMLIAATHSRGRHGG